MHPPCTQQTKTFPSKIHKKNITGGMTKRKLVELFQSSLVLFVLFFVCACIKTFFHQSSFLFLSQDHISTSGFISSSMSFKFISPQFVNSERNYSLLKTLTSVARLRPKNDLVTKLQLTASNNHLIFIENA